MYTIFNNCILFDGINRELKENAAIVVKDNIIENVVLERNKIPKKIDAKVIDCNGMYMLPGLINVHEHQVFKRSGFELREILATSDYLYSIYATKSAISSLKAGITTIREMGARNNINFAVRLAIKNKIMMGPRVIACGTPLSITGAHASKISWQVDGVDEVCKAVRTLLNQGADFIKIFTSCDPVETGENELAYSEPSLEELEMAVKESHKKGKKVAVHCTGTKALKNVIKANVDTIEHGVYMNEEIAEEIKEKGIIYVPTISGYWEMGNSEWGWPESFHELYRRLREPHMNSVRMAINKGVKIAIGTDSNGDFVDELRFLIKSGMSTIDVLIAATKNGAETIGLEKNIGTIEKGKIADLIILKGNPLNNIESLREINTVVLDGNVLDFDTKK